VTWRQGAGYVGWAPLPPTARITVSGHVEIHEPAHPPRAFVFVEERRLLEPVRPQTVIVNNSTVINKTVNITKIKVVNKTVVNEGPRPEAIERVSGRKVQSLPTHDVRRKEEKGVVSRQRNVPSNAARKTVSPQVTAPPSRVTPPADRPAPVTTAPAQNPTRDVRKPAEQRSAESQSESTQTNVVATPQRSAPPATKPVETAKQPQPRPGRQAQKAAETKSAVAVMQPQTQTPVRKEHDRVMTRDNESSKLQRAAVTRTPHLPPKQAEMQADTKKGKAAAAKAAENAKKKKRSAPEGTSVQETPPQAPPPATSQP
jgi:hypothetical protein